jgi:hypothetical protein
MEGETRRERLARLGLERMQHRPKSGWEARATRLFDFWQRFLAFSSWEKSFFLLGCALAVAISVGAVFALSRGGGGSAGDNGGGRPAVIGQPGATEAGGDLDATPTTIAFDPADIPTPLPTATFEPTPEEVRRDCDEIRGTPYRSDAERDWFVANCDPEGDGAEPTPAGSGPATQPPPPPPPPPPTDPPAQVGLSAAEAISLAASWMANSGTKAYDVDTGSCTAADFGAHWVVTCSAQLAGCQSAACRTTLSACVFEDPRRVVSAAQC